MKSKKQIILTVLLTLTSMSVFADGSFNGAGLQSRLLEIQNRLRLVMPMIERQDLPRMKVLERSVNDFMTTLRTNPAFSLSVGASLQEWVLRARFSEALFTRIQTEWTKDSLDRIQMHTEAIAKDSGFDMDMHTRITQSVFSQFKQLFDELPKLPISDNLRRQIATLNVPIGQTIAQGSDSAAALDFAQKRLEQIKSMIPEIEKNADSSKAVYDFMAEIQGLMEFYLHFLGKDV